MREIQTLHGTILLDDEDAPLVEGARIRVLVDDKRRSPYPRALVRLPGWKSSRVLSRFLVNPPAGMVVDHVNGNPLDNRRQNLRVCTQAENVQARRPRQGANEWGYKGIVRYRPSNSHLYYWAAILGGPGSRRRLFNGADRDPSSPHRAALHYNKAALAAYGEFAYLNDVPCFSEDPRPSDRCPTCHAACECCCVCPGM